MTRGAVDACDAAGVGEAVAFAGGRELGGGRVVGVAKAGAGAFVTVKGEGAAFSFRA
jgi:hypothetical protein